jgi:3-hydroxyisobutyrate dehydrogenase-like beta-hydroxyacid dehydrogenase
MPEQDETRRLGWLGTGRMGSEMARRLLAAGCDLAVYNRTRAKAEPLAELGAKVVGSAADLGGRDIVFTTVGSPEDLLASVLGPDGLMSQETVPAVLVDCSTVSPEASSKVREELARHLDARRARDGQPRSGRRR